MPCIRSIEELRGLSFWSFVANVNAKLSHSHARVTAHVRCAVRSNIETWFPFFHRPRRPMLTGGQRVPKNDSLPATLESGCVLSGWVFGVFKGVAARGPVWGVAPELSQVLLALLLQALEREKSGQVSPTPA